MTDNHSRGASSSDTPPDRGAAGDVSTTGRSDRETGGFSSTTAQAGPTMGHESHPTSGPLDADTHGGHPSGHGGHADHLDDAADVPTIVPTTWRQLIFPALILLLVVILVSGPIASAFQSRPAPAPTNPTGGQGVEPGVQATAVPAQGQPTPISNGVNVTPGLATTPTTPSSLNIATPATVADVAATRTAVAVAATTGQVARAPVRLDFGGDSFVVKAGDTLLPDWRPPQDQGIATWIQGSVANHILYVPYSEANAQLFKAAKKGDKTSLLMNTGQLFEFVVTRSERAYNGPPADVNQFTVTAAMSQDHAGVTLFLIGDTTQDRAVVQADFTGNIQ